MKMAKPISYNRGSNIQAALNFVGKTSWTEVQAMGIDNYLQQVTKLLPEGQVFHITRLQQHDGSHVNGPSIAVEGKPSVNDEIMGNCNSTQYIASGYTDYMTDDCNTYQSAATVCHCSCAQACNWTCGSSNYYESTC